MVRRYKRTSSRASYGSQALNAAVEAVRSGTAVKAAARMYGIPARTIRRHRDLNVSRPGTTKLGSKETVFKPEYETILVQHVQAMEKALFGLTTLDIRRLAYDLAKHMKIEHPFKNKCAGVDWLKGFLHRHQHLAVRSPEATSIGRAVGFNRPQVEKFYGVFAEALDKTHADALRIWNMDESGISNVHKPVNIVATKGARSVGKITSGEKGKTVTVICAMNAAGSTFVPPAFIFPRKRMAHPLMNGAPAGALGLCSASGWTDNEIFLRWLEHFVAFVKCTPEEPHILLLDGHHSHKMLEACLYARDKGLIIITFPPHCTHRLQPLDVSFFKSLKSVYNVESGNWMTSNPGRRITMFEVAAIFASAYNRCASVQKAVSGFQSCGVWPYNPEKFTDDDYAASYLTEEPLPSDSQSVSTTTAPDQTAATVAPIIQATATSVHTSTEDLTLVTIALPVMVTTATTAAQVSSVTTSLDTITQDSALVTGQTASSADVLTTTTATTVPEACSVTGTDSENSQFRAVMLHLSPKPHITVKRARKRKAESAANVTSSPFKQMLVEKKASKPVAKYSKVSKKSSTDKNKAKAKKTTRVSTGTVKPKLKKTEQCRGCGLVEGSLEDMELQQGWIACEGCGKWFHDMCAEENGLLDDDYFTCKSCVA